MAISINPRHLTISWGDDERYWHWINGVTPRLLRVCWLDIRGKFDMSRLRCGAMYQLAFVAELEPTASGWESTLLTLKLNLPDGCSTTRVIRLHNHPRGQLLMLPAGEFVAGGRGHIRFAMVETEGGNWKTGLIIRRVAIQPMFT